MKTISDVIVQIIYHVSPYDIMNGRFSCSGIPEESFRELMMAYSDRYSYSDLESLYQVCSDRTKEWMRRKHGWKAANGESSLRVFDMVLGLAEWMLLIQEGNVVCHYERLLDWRQVAVQLDEAMFVAALLAMDDLERGTTRREFCWETVLGHNNQFLNWMMKKGISENHFHLWASSPHFHISWIILMNRADRYSKQFREIDDRRLKHSLGDSLGKREPKLGIQHLQAALIRLYLFSWLTERRIGLDEYLLRETQLRAKGETWHDLLPYSIREILADWRLDDGLTGVKKRHVEEMNGANTDSQVRHAVYRLIQRIGSDKDYLERRRRNGDIGAGTASELFDSYVSTMGYIPLELLDGLIPKERFRVYWEEQTVQTMEEWLCDDWKLESMAVRLQSIINSFRDKEFDEAFEEGNADYIFLELESLDSETGDIPQWLSGENWLLYHMFRHVYDRKIACDYQCNIFYMYLVLKEKLRHEMLQSNDRRGLENFIRYQDRKEYFTSEKRTNQMVAVMAISDTLCSQHILQLEVRISPGDTARENMEYVREIDTLMEKEEKKLGKDLRSRYYFVFHFPKSLDKTPKDQLGHVCRHYLKRREIEKKAVELANFREKYCGWAERVLGIDSCSQEIGCRPEVFACSFRFLKDHSNRNRRWEGEKRAPQLHITYHVGEDFLDIADGLRAIEEAVRFLNMDYGDRIGHALALGMDVKAWYEGRNCRIRISQQDYLDNLAWIYGKIVRMHISELEDLKNFTEHEFERYFRMIYTNNFNADFMKSILEKANLFSSSRGTGTHTHFYFNITTYYNSWKLRGDNPDCYKRGFFMDSNRYDKNIAGYDVNDKYPKEFNIRYIPEIAFLYYSYHFDEKVKLEGRKMIDVTVPPVWVEGVQIIQKRIQGLLEKRGIAIETNPSSNVLIGLMDGYESHPIVKWYNHHLVSNPKLLDECPQLSVSINTDDQGIFNTSLENEYALMACALENVKNPDGSPAYSRMMIYEWLDKVREFGNLQSFRNFASHPHYE